MSPLFYRRRLPTSRMMYRRTLKPLPRLKLETIPVEIEDREVTVGDETVHVRAVRDISKRKEWENEILLAKQEAEQQDVSL